jgi:hypothetical protein
MIDATVSRAHGKWRSFALSQPMISPALDPSAF